MPAPHRARYIGTRHMVASGHYLAAQAAFQILEAGGNAIDAGVAGGLTLGVVQSEYVGFAGVAPVMIYLAEKDEFITLSGLGPWPKAARLEVFQNEHGGAMPPGLLRTVVPAAPQSWITALERYGTISFGEAVAAAHRFASQGFPVPTLMCEVITKGEKAYRQWDQTAAIYLPGGKPPQPGDVLVQSDLGNVIGYMIDEEKAAAAKGGRAAGLKAARDAFYRGDIAVKMVRYHIENDGWLRHEDLADFEVDIAPALTSHFDGAEILTCGPWCQGPLIGQTFNMLDGINLKGMGHNSTAYIHHLTEVFKLAYADRHAYIGDPKFVDVPIDTLMSAEYARERRKAIDSARAAPDMPMPGDVGMKSEAGRGKRETVTMVDELDTSYVCVVDRHGNAFSGTPSDASTGSPVIPGLGFVPSSRGTQSWTDPSVPGVMAPGKRPRLTPNPAMARKRGEWLMPFGSPGNDVQPQAMLQVFLNIHLWGMTPQQAVEQPRFAGFSYPRSSAPHSYDPGLLRLEGRIPEETGQALSAMGHDVQMWPDWDWLAGAVCTIVADQKNGTMEGASDPRRPTAVAGW
jgi:gamma-glutamyltranspeptidase/glutathione hydrolase